MVYTNKHKGCTSHNPCRCLGKITPRKKKKTGCCSNCNCLCLCDIIITAEEGVGPCGQAGTINVADMNLYKHDTCVCKDNPLNWSLEGFEGPLTSVEVNPDGEVIWITGDSESAGRYSTIVLKACCGKYASYLTLIVGTKPLCDCAGCNQCEECDPCTGECIEPKINIELETVESNVNLNTHGS